MRLSFRATCVTLSLVTAPFAAAAQDSDTALIDKGRYLATAGDCIACHTAAKGKPFAGGYPFHLPMGTIISSNITPAETNGIGTWTEEQFARAVREGVRPDGTRLYPAMPYTEYSLITDEDMKALYAYFMKGVEPVEERPAAETKLQFPFNLPGTMMVWNALFHDNTRFEPDARATDEINRGRYLADGLGHCTTCHTPRNDMMALDKGQYLGGGFTDGWHAPNITSDPVSGIGGWSNDEIVEYLRNGNVRGKSQAGGPMAHAIEYSFRHMRQEDLQAIAAYLKTTTPIKTPGQDKPAYASGARQESFTAFKFPIPDNQSPERFNLSSVNGASLYNSACSACHGINGEGAEDDIAPSLTHNRAVGSVFPNGGVMAVAQGIHRKGADYQVSMPAFASDVTAIHAAMNDDQIASITNYVRSRFGGIDQEISGGDVRTIIQGGEQPFLIRNAATLATIGFAGGGIVAMVLAWLLLRRLGKNRRQVAAEG